MPAQSGKPQCTEPPLNPYDDTSTTYGKISDEVFNTVPKIVPSDHLGSGLGGTQSNWIGPFTHAGGRTSNNQYANPSTQTTSEGDNWGGGSEWSRGIVDGKVGNQNNKQIYPFPVYYYARFLGALNGDTGEYDSTHTANWNVCPLSDLTDGVAPSANAINCINTKIISPAVEAAVAATNKAKNELSDDGKIPTGIPDIQLSDVLDKSSDAGAPGFWGIAPSANSANNLYNYYSSTSDEDIKTITTNYQNAVTNCPIPTQTGGEFSLKDIAKAWIFTAGGAGASSSTANTELYIQRMRDCPAALIVISGETTCVNPGTAGDWSTTTCKNIHHGVWQVTSPDGTPISSGCANSASGEIKDCLAKSTVCNATKINTNVCCQADFVNTHLYTNQSYKIASLGMFNKGYGYCGGDAAPHYCAGNSKMECTPAPTTTN